MAHVREVQRKDGSPAWETRWRENGAFKQRTFPTEDAAREFVVELKITRRDGDTTAHLVRYGKKFREVAEASMAASAARLKPKTAGQYELAYRLHIYPTFGERRINSISSMDIEGWLADMQTKVSAQTGRTLAPASVLGAYVALSKAFGYAMKHRMIAVNPCAVVDKPRLRHEEPVFLSPDQVAAVAAELDAHAPYGLIVRFAAYTGLRAGELAALRIRDINFLRRHVEVRRTLQRVKGGWAIGSPKSARSTRDVPLSRDLLAELAAYVEQHPHRLNRDAALWPGRIPGGHGDRRAPLDYDRQFDVASVYRHYFKPALKRLDIPDVRWHDLRHFYASACAAAGIEIRKVSRWMGHANINTTDSIYTHLFNGGHDADMDALDAVSARISDVRPVARLDRLG